MRSSDLVVWVTRKGKFNFILVPIYSLVSFVGLTTLRIFGKATSRNMMFWTGDEVKKLYGKAKTILFLAVS